MGLEESLSLKKPGDFIPLVKPKKGTKGSPTRKSPNALRLMNPTSETTSLEMARLRRLSVPLTPTGISVVNEVKRFNELEDRLDQPVNLQVNKKRGKTKEDKPKDDDNKLQEVAIKSNEAVSKALSGIAKEQSSQFLTPGHQRSGHVYPADQSSFGSL